VVSHVRVRDQRTQAQPAVGGWFDVSERQMPDVGPTGRPLHLLTPAVDEVGAARYEPRPPVAGDLPHRRRHVVDSQVGEAIHHGAPPAVARITAWIAARMFG